MDTTYKSPNKITVQHIGSRGTYHLYNSFNNFKSSVKCFILECGGNTFSFCFSQSESINFALTSYFVVSLHLKSSDGGKKELSDVFVKKGCGVAFELFFVMRKNK